MIVKGWAEPRAERIVIEDVRPNVNAGRYPAKRIVGEALDVRASIIKEGHDVLQAKVELWQGEQRIVSLPLTHDVAADDWHAGLPLDVPPGLYAYRIVTWTDTYGSWLEEFRRKVGARADIESEALQGVALIRAAAAGADGKRALAKLETAATRLEGAGTGAARLTAAANRGLVELIRQCQPRADETASPLLPLVVDREQARWGAWYEMFPRSYGRRRGEHGTFRSAAKRLPAIAAMGFDVVYLPPIHPIGETNRKGKNNAPVAGPGDVGSPWAIGSKAGGHDAIAPALGTLEDFHYFSAEARRLGMELALDFAIQCSPDHPYVKQHPGWFKRRPDGTVKYAENPPKKYEDIVALDMWCEDWPALWAELLRVVQYWVAQGVEIFRVDNPHTKPIGFWEWLIGEVKREHPGVVFLSEAFTDPKKLELLAKVGFSQSYTYFTWRNTTAELEAYLTELTRTDRADYLRPNFFANTPDILHEYLQRGGRPAFKVRAALAATLSPAYGIYSGFELCENVPLRPGSEEYLDSEKYELKWRDWKSPASIAPYLTTLNAIRNDNSALRGYTNLHFHASTNPDLLVYSKATALGDNRILVVANLNAQSAEEGMVTLVGPPLQLTVQDSYTVHDLISGESYPWRGLVNFVRLDPRVEPVHIFRLEPK